MTAAIALPNTAQIQTAIASAAARTGVDFDYLLATAKRESGLKTEAKSASSSASGLFQFIDQTWLSMVKNHGAKHGLEAEAAQIEKGSNGRYTIADESAKEAILALRHDPKTASLMAGELTREAANTLKGKLGRAVSQGELYMAHFLGASGAAKFIAAKDLNPDAPAAQSFGREAAANRSVFFDPEGRMRNMAEVYDRLTKLHSGTGTDSGAPVKTQHEASERPAYAPGPDIGVSNEYYPKAAIPSYSGFSLGSLTSRLTPQVMMILSSLDLPFGDD